MVNHANGSEWLFSALGRERVAGYRVVLVTDRESWLKRHALFVTAVGGALHRKNCDARLLASDKRLIGTLILAVREGCVVLDSRGEYYFARHSRHATKGMAALVEDLRAFFVDHETPHLSLLYDQDPV